LGEVENSLRSLYILHQMLDARCLMRTTLTIDDDVLDAARGLAERERKTVGEVISQLARTALAPPSVAGRRRNGLPLLPTKDPAVRVTLELVNRLRDEE